MTAVAPAVLRTPRILIVDDERQNRQLMEVMLGPEGFLLRTAASGEEALAMVAEEAPDLILLDIMMPGMDGYQVAERIKGNLATKDIPLIMVTALGDRTSRMRGLGAGAEDFITKPVDRAELCVRVRNLARLKALGDERYDRKLEGEVDSRTASLLARTNTLEQKTAVLTEQAALLDLAQDAIVVRDLDGRIMFWSRGAEVMYGWDHTEAVGRDMNELLQTRFTEPPAEIEAALQRYGQWEGEAIHYRRAGTPVNVASRWALQRDAAGAGVRVLTINNDITARKRSDADLLSLSQRLALATAIGKVGVWEWDLDTNTLTWDATMFDIYGRAPILPMPYDLWAAAVHSEDLPAAKAAMRTTIADKGQGSAEYRIARPDGSMRNISAVQRAVLDENGNVSRVIGVNMDVTERKHAEGVLEHQLRFKDDFLSHVSHELRSPLTAIKQFSSILLAGLAGELNPEQREYQEIVLKNIGQLQAMIDDLLEVTRLETGKLTIDLESVSLANAVTDSLNTLQGAARAKGVTLSLDLAPDLPQAHADQTRVRQILIILLDNGIKFTPEGGEVSIQVRVQPEDPRFLTVTVADTGCGISPEVADRVFERLYQVSDPVSASRKGLGLGLYICRELVTRQGGRVWAERRPEKGSAFSFTLPVLSLRSAIAPLLRNDQWPAESISLVMAEAVWPTGCSDDLRASWSQELRAIVLPCLLPDLDALLPNLTSDSRIERLFIVVFSDETGAAALANRIKGQIERSARLNGAWLSPTMSFIRLQPLPQVTGGSTEEILSHMAAHLTEAITTHTTAAIDHD
ncbi:MAG: response regulator [Gemmatimonadota bacterium]